MQIIDYHVLQNTDSDIVYLVDSDSVQIIDSDGKDRTPKSLTNHPGPVAGPAASGLQSNYFAESQSIDSTMRQAFQSTGGIVLWITNST